MLELEDNAVESPNKRQRIFTTHQALLDYCCVFNIINAAFGKAKVEGKDVFILEYHSEQ